MEQQKSFIPIYSIILSFLTLFCHFLDECFRIPANLVNFSGESMKKLRFYTLISSSFFHGDRSHLLKELTLLVPLSIVLENKIGGLLFIFYYFIMGIIGCLITWYLDRRYFSSKFSDGLFLADLIWSRGASGNVYGIACLSSILCSNTILFSSINKDHYGIYWLLLTNILFHIFRKTSKFQSNNKYRSYFVLLLICILVIYIHNIYNITVTINVYLLVYFIHMAIFRLYPGIFNKRNVNYIPSDYKTHLICATFGVIFGLMIYFNDNNIHYNNSINSGAPYVSILISDGVCGQYIVHKRIERNIALNKEREKKKQQNQQSKEV